MKVHVQEIVHYANFIYVLIIKQMILSHQSDQSSIRSEAYHRAIDFL